MLSQGPMETSGNIRKYWHVWMQASDDISEDIAVWHELMPGYSEAMEKYEAVGVIQGEAAAKHSFCNIRFSYE